MYICSLFASWLIVNIYCIFMRNRHFFLIAILSMFCSGLTLSAQTLIFVSSSASNDNGDGLTWGTAKRNISAGITAAGTSGVVCVKAGTYNINDELTIPAGVVEIEVPITMDYYVLADCRLDEDKSGTTYSFEYYFNKDKNTIILENID